MIKSEVKADENVVETPEYPKLMVSRATGAILLFNEEECGMVINAGSSKVYTTGHYSESWDMSCFKRFEGSVTLTQ